MRRTGRRVGRYIGARPVGTRDSATFPHTRRTRMTMQPASCQAIGIFRPYYIITRARACACIHTHTHTHVYTTHTDHYYNAVRATHEIGTYRRVHVRRTPPHSSFLVSVRHRPCRLPPSLLFVRRSRPTCLPTYLPRGLTTILLLYVHFFSSVRIFLSRNHPSTHTPPSIRTSTIMRVDGPSPSVFLKLYRRGPPFVYIVYRNGGCSYKYVSPVRRTTTRATYDFEKYANTAPLVALIGFP